MIPNWLPTSRHTTFDFATLLDVQYLLKTQIEFLYAASLQI